MQVYTDLIGKTFNRLTVIEKMPPVFNGRRRWRCSCVCGGETIVPTFEITSGGTKSCGCLGIEILRANRVKHMENKNSKEYMAWCGMKARCYNKNGTKYSRYGKRGIIVCDRWRDNFSNFLEDMGRAPTAEHSLDRIDNDGNYEPINCRWAIELVQANNKSTCVNIEHLGEVKTMKQWADHYSIPYKRLHADLKYKGRTLEEVLAKRLKTPQNA